MKNRRYGLGDDSILLWVLTKTRDMFLVVTGGVIDKNRNFILLQKKQPRLL
jgi:hypothetical protein